MKYAIVVLLVLSVLVIAVPEQEDLQYLEILVDDTLMATHSNKAIALTYQIYQYAVTNEQNTARAWAKWNHTGFARASNTNVPVHVFSQPVIEFGAATKATYTSAWATNVIGKIVNDPKAAIKRLRKSERAAWRTAKGVVKLPDFPFP